MTRSDARADRLRRVLAAIESEDNTTAVGLLRELEYEAFVAGDSTAGDLGYANLSLAAGHARIASSVVLRLLQGGRR